MRKYEITKEQIRLIEHQSINMDYGQVARDVREWFPDAFKTVLKFGKWYKSNNGVLKFFVTNETAYGFNSDGHWRDLSGGYDLNDLDKSRVKHEFNWAEASKKEVKVALLSEAEKRYNQGFLIKCPIYEADNYTGIIKGHIYWADGSELVAVNCIETNRPNPNFALFHNGKWAEIIPTITKQEAEKQLGMKIID